MKESADDESGWRAVWSIGLQLPGYVLLGGVVLFATRLDIRSANDFTDFGAGTGAMTQAAIATARTIEDRRQLFAAGWVIFVGSATVTRACGRTAQFRILNWAYAFATLGLAAFLVVTIALSYLNLMQNMNG